MRSIPLLLTLLLAPAPAAAATFQWTGAGSNVLNDPANWSPAGVPGPADVASFGTGSAIAVQAASVFAVGRIECRRDVTFSGAAIELWGTPDAGTGEDLAIYSLNATPVFQSDLTLARPVTFGVVTSLGPRTLRISGAIDDGPSQHRLTLRPAGATTVQLDGANTMDGGVTLHSTGALRIASAGALGGGRLEVPGGGDVLLATPAIDNDLDLDGSIDLIAEVPVVRLNGVVDGNGGRIFIRSQPAGHRVELAGANVFDQPVSIVAGATLRALSDGALGAATTDTAILQGGTLQLDGGITVPEPIAAVINNGPAFLDSLSGHNVVANALGGVFLDVDVVQDSLTVQGAAHVYLSKYGAGTLRLDGMSTGSRPVDVAEGALLVNGTHGGAFTVASGALLGGIGTITGDVTVDGTLAPGEGIGTLTVRGNVTLAGTFDAELGDELAVLLPRTVTLGGTLAVTGTPAPNTSYVLVNAGPDVSVTGAFAGLSEGADVLGLTLTYAGGDGNDVVLVAPPMCVDAGPPVVSDCPSDLVLECEGMGQAIASFSTPTATDDCDDNPTVLCSPPSGAAFDLGVSAVACEAQDATGNTTSGACAFTVTVQDTTPPAIACPADQTLTVDPGTPAVFTEATATDACGEVQVSCAPASGDVLAPASYAVTCTADDGVAPVATCGFGLTVLSSNQAPVADAGADQNVSYTVTAPLVTLDGCASSDDGLPNPPGALSFTWTQLAGPTVSLSSASACAPSFTAPALAPGSPEVLTFELAVDDGDLSATDVVGVLVTNVNRPPECHASAPPAVAEGTLGVTLDGTSSFDPDGDAIAHAWSQQSGPAVAITAADTALASFDAPVVGQSLTLVFVQTVDDGLLTATCTVGIDVTNVNQCPVADAGTGETVVEGAAVTLDGSASVDPDQDVLTYAWTQLSGTPVVLAGADTAAPSFTAPDIPGAVEDLQFELTVSDGACATVATVTISVRADGSPPTCASARVRPRKLWPPNHRMRRVRIRGVDGDIRIDGVSQDEPVNGPGCGHTAPDAIVRGDRLFLRAERQGFGNGRIYEVSFTAENEFGSCTGTVKVCVPKRGRRRGCVDDGVRYDSMP